jgi:DNA replication and repair protein RecF
MQIKELKLTNFRKFKNFSLNFNEKWTIIVAPNAYGKSTIVEAIYLLANGDSPWTSDTSTLLHQPPKNTERKNPDSSDNAYEKLVKKTLRLEAEVETTEEFKNLAVSIQKNNDSLTKNYEIEGSNTTKNKFAENIHTILFSPQMIDLLMYEPRQRRKFLDDQISRTDYYYSDLINKYNKVRRQRNSLLKIIRKKHFQNKYNGSSDDSSKVELTKGQERNLKFWTDQIIDIGAKIIKKRIDFIHTINTSLSEDYQAQIRYSPKVNISQLEELASTDHIKKLFQSQLRSSYEKECSVGTTIVGPHRDDWNLEMKDVNLNIYGSRGEKRMAIADIIFKINKYLTDEIGQPPIVLLDDISSELDQTNINLLFEKKINPNQQAIITTTSLEQIPQKAQEDSQIITLEKAAE